MSEYIISDEGIEAERRQAYEAGKRNRNVWTAKAYHGEQIVRCRDCEHSRKDGTLCMFFASWEPIAGGDEYAEIPADVEYDGFCKWGDERE